jgi:medium-chain acyl-[acyl-carrier-protein] hydrolase
MPTMRTRRCVWLVRQRLAFGGADDPHAPPTALRAWQLLTQADFAWHCFPGGHFYLNEQVQPLLATIAGYLACQAAQI